MIISKQAGIVSNVTDLTSTAREVVFTLENAIECLPGSFVNVFMDIDGALVRRAYSVVSTDTEKKTITISVRCSLKGTMSPMFWKPEILGTPVQIMGPMGKNTADKLTATSLYLFGYGIGAGIIKAIAEHSLENPLVQHVSITTGSRNESDIVYKSYFDEIAKNDSRVSVRYVISNPVDTAYPYIGYIQNHIADINFDNADVYMCGQGVACDALTLSINEKNPQNTHFFVEAFH